MAKAFKFRLETVLKLRKRREDEHKRVVAGRLREVHQARMRNQSLEEQIDFEIQGMRSSVRVGTIETGRIARHRHWLSHLNRQMLENQGQTRTLQAKLAMEQVQLADATKQCKVLEKLKDRQFDRYRRTLAKQEQLAIDEVATMRYACAQEAIQLKDSLKNVMGIVGLLSLVNVLALAGLLAFLFGTGRLNAERVSTIGRVVRGQDLVPAAATTQPTTQPATTEAAEKHIARDSVQEEHNRRTTERAAKELSDQEAVLRALMMELITKEEALAAREKALVDAQLRIRKEEQDRGFKKNLAYLSSIKPDTAKLLLQDMKEPDSVRFLLEMEPDTGKKIIDKCITQEDRQWIGRVLDQIRARDVLRAEALVAHSSRKKR